MRVSGGSLKGKRLYCKGLGDTSRHGVLRATSAKVRESIFNILANRIKDAAFLDLYAGTGAVGLEAKSRGAGKLWLVEADGDRCEEITKLVEGCGCRGFIEIVNRKAVDFIRSLAGEGMEFDIIFLDPPYGSEELAAIMPDIARAGVLSDGAVVLAEHPSKSPLPEGFDGLSKRKTYKYGDTSLTLFIKARFIKEPG